jgi:hypothetical protein
MSDAGGEGPWALPGGGLPTVYQAVFWVAREELNVVPDLSIAQATERFRSATERSALP